MNNPGFNKQEINKRIIGIINGKIDLPHYKIFYFGSRAKGNATERSDIDLGIQANETIPPAVLSEIRSGLDDLPILQKIDVVDFNSVGGDFKAIALQRIEVIYEK
jgi:predicted nucleotidyltransferase